MRDRWLTPRGTRYDNPMAEQLLEAWGHLWHLGVAFLLALPIGWDRERAARSAGLRTFPLVAMGACAYILAATAVFEGDDPQARIAYGLVTGIGFIGGGAIIKQGSRVSGTATAASIWSTGAIGMTVAYDLFSIAIVLSVANFLTLLLIAPLKQHAKRTGNGNEDEIESDGDDQQPRNSND
jgi:putative Mg2+ transporter-C (MgtC) family protein